MKIFRQIAIVSLLVITALCMTIFASACNTAKEYTITVYYSDGTVVDGTKDRLLVQICDASNTFCYKETPEIDANGQVKFTIADIDADASEVDSLTSIPEEYVLHVSQPGVGQLELEAEVKVSKSNPSVSITLKDRVAPQN